MRWIGLSLAVFALGCGRSGEFESFGTVPADLASGVVVDLAVDCAGVSCPTDMGRRPDMGRRGDMGRDMGRRGDMAAPDLAMPAPPDLATPADLSEPPADLSEPPDLARTTGCTNDTQCPGARCDWLTGQCVPIASCTADNGCPRGSVCLANQCLPIQLCAPFPGAPRCPTGEHCQFPPGVCTPDSNCGGGCPGGERCVAGYCQPDACTSAAQCNDGYDCVAGRCRPRRYCGPLDPCPRPERCAAHVCGP